MEHAHKRDWVDYARLISGALCLAAGLAKAFPQIEDIPKTFQKMAAANAGTILEPVSNFIVQNSGTMTIFSGLALGLSGLAFLLNRLVAPAALGQILLFACFVTLLFRSVPAIAAIDAPFAAVALLVLRRALKPKTVPAAPHHPQSH